MSGTSKRKRIKIDPVKFQYSEEQPHSTGDISLFPHQADFFRSMIHALDNNNSKLFFLESMTGSGKTIANIMPALEKRSNIILSYPTNALIEDQYNSIKEDSEEFGFQDKINIEKINSGYLQNERMNKDKNIPDILYDKFGNAMADHSRAHVFLTNPDTLYNVLTGKYWSSSGFSEPMDRAIENAIGGISYFVFDEFHMYDVSQETSILNLSLLIHQNKGISRSIVFSSATPDDDFKKRLKAISENGISVFKDDQSRSNGGSKTIAGDLDLEIVFGKKWNAPSFFINKNEENVLSLIEGKSKEITAIFESEKRTLDLVELLKNEYPSLKDLMAYNTGHLSSDLSITEPEVRLQIGTRTLSVGIDFETRNLFFESYRARDFLQKLGRTGRRGKGSKAICYTSEYSFDLEEMKDSYMDRKQFERDVLKNMRQRNDLRGFITKYGPLELGNMKKDFKPALKGKVIGVSNRIYHKSPRSDSRYEEYLMSFRDPGVPQVAVSEKNRINFQNIINFLETQEVKSLVSREDFITKEENKRKSPVKIDYIERKVIDPILFFSERPQRESKDVCFTTTRYNEPELGLIKYPNEAGFKFKITGDNLDSRIIHFIEEKLSKKDLLIYVLDEGTYKDNRGLIPHLFRTYDLKIGSSKDYKLSFGQNALKLDSTFDLE
ncbi:MAG: CRISPR-Cas system related heleicase, Cas3 containing HD nuclease domain [Candidatus Methanohalarchaeum thermophilum]|uniref:CRISPR-Cas system related heleicase, Cas3 containing HD nuclease domain n=1 Tax=Methanohalarchaeum thermophilum TaxID=1903181 RepID=A0A1Q6DWX0_METT1|nr:MAG: CRISPR-Cas system related heleicase, Cas3 containing HD nuclease domain [Candidatus Methanohalarchaeum thermophilum]